MKITISSHTQEFRTLKQHARWHSSIDTNLLEQEIFLCWPHCVTSYSLYCTLPQLGHPIVGDVKYGAPQTFKTRDIALHAYALTVAHPITTIEVKYLGNFTFHFCSPILRSTHFILILHISDLCSGAYSASLTCLFKFYSCLLNHICCDLNLISDTVADRIATPSKTRHTFLLVLFYKSSLLDFYDHSYVIVCLLLP